MSHTHNKHFNKQVTSDGINLPVDLSDKSYYVAAL